MTEGKRRRRGTGSIEQMPDGSFRPRLPNRGPRLDPCPTYEEAERLLDAAIVEIVEGRAVDPRAETLRSWGDEWLDEREHDGYDINSDRSRWRVHIETADFIDWPLKVISQADIYFWLDALKKKKAAKGFGHKKQPRRTLGKTTKQNTLNLLRCCFEDARLRKKILINPCDGVKLGRRDRNAVTHEPWTYLEPKEQNKLLNCTDIPERDRLMIAFAIGTGIRQSEQWNLYLRDLRLPEHGVWEAVIRYGSDRVDRRASSRRVEAKGGPTKGGRPRRVQIFGLAREALARWLELLADHPNKFDLVWPSPWGYRRQPGEPRLWKKWLLMAGIKAKDRHDQMPVRWHDLRHTCGASLISGWWGRSWPLEEIKELLGHEDIATTLRYAHLANDAKKKAAEKAHKQRMDQLQEAAADDEDVVVLK